MLFLVLRRENSYWKSWFERGVDPHCEKGKVGLLGVVKVTGWEQNL